MTARKKKEAVTVSFHYLARVSNLGTENAVQVPITQTEFDDLFEKIQDLPETDFADEATLDKIRDRNHVPLENCKKHNKRIIYGTFRASYWGHSYNNSALGKVPASSVSLRPFHFLLYLSEDGKIYMGTQYLGQFGGYVGLKTTLVNLMSRPDSIRPYSFRVGADAAHNVRAQEVRVRFSDKSKRIEGGNKFTDQGMIAFKKVKGDDFEGQVATGLFSLFGSSKSEIKTGIAELLSNSDLIEIADTDIEDCTVIAKVDGRKKVIYMLGDSQFASRLHLNVPIDDDGHPDYESTKIEMLRLLSKEVISRREDV